LDNFINSLHTNPYHRRNENDEAKENHFCVGQRSTMNVNYAITQLIRRPGRTLAAIFSVALGIMLFVSLQAYANGYRQAARAPLTQIGADLAAQRQGNVPDKFEGIVFPHSVAPIHRAEIDQIEKVSGVQAVAEVLFFWDFEPAGFTAGLGVNPADNFGPGRLRASIVSGRFLQVGDQGVAVADSTYAQQKGISLGSVVQIAGKDFKIVGLADTTRAGQLANANLYIPLSDARSMANAAPQVRSVFDIRPDDANLLFIKVDQTHSEEAAKAIQAILGEKATVTTGQSFAAELGALFGMVDRFGILVGLVAFLFAAATLLRLEAAGIWERRSELALMRALGWRRREVVAQMWVEAAFVSLAGALVGLGLSALATWLISRATVSVPVPWELSPSPHFLPGGATAFAVVVTLPAQLTPALIGWAVGLAILSATIIGIWLPGRIANIKPAEVFRGE
jgi:ABC-type antimicrobial peptide transport system permease subunit